MADTLTIACLQTDPVIGDVDANLARQRSMVAEAVERGAGMVVLPECSTGGYVFDSPDEAATVAEDIAAGDGPALMAWQQWCAQYGIHLVGGLVERSGDDLYNAAALVGPDGVIGGYRKTHLWGIETGLYRPGDLGLPVYDTPVGRIGMLICYDAWFPECARIEALQGADLICMPANWVPVPTQADGVPVIANQLCMTAAHTNLVYVAAASRVGVERGQPFIGRSIVVDHTGAPLAGPASGTEEEIVTATIAPIGSRAERRGNPFNQPLRDRRLDLYGEMLGSAHAPGPY
jgi:N-carbamoylputrescine amidase